MRCLGLVIKKNEIWYSVVEGEKMESAVLHETGKQNYRTTSQTLMLDFSNIFLELITKYNPHKVVYKLSLDIKMEQIPYLHYSLGILELLCTQKGIPVRGRSSKWISAGKKIKIVKCEDFFASKKFKPDEKAATIIAWYELGE